MAKKKEEIRSVLQDLVKKKLPPGSVRPDKISRLATLLTRWPGLNAGLITGIIIGSLFSGRSFFTNLVDFSDSEYWIKKILEIIEKKGK